MSGTSKPCPMCKSPGGKTGTFYTRPVDGVCAACEKLYAEAVKWKAASKAQEDYRLYRLNSNSFFEGKNGAPGCFEKIASVDEYGVPTYTEESSPRYCLSDLMERLGLALSQQITDSLPEPDYTEKHDCPRLFPGGTKDYQAWNQKHVYLNPTIGGLIGAIDVYIRKCLLETSKAGVRHGQNFLVQLANNEIALADYEEEMEK